MYLPLYERLAAQFAAGQKFSVADIDSAIAEDREAAAAFKAVADELRAGSDVSIEAVAARTGFPVEFLEACEMARVSGGELVALRINHGATVH